MFSRGTICLRCTPLCRRICRKTLSVFGTRLSTCVVQWSHSIFSVFHYLSSCVIKDLEHESGNAVCKSFHMSFWCAIRYLAVNRDVMGKSSAAWWGSKQVKFPVALLQLILNLIFPNAIDVMLRIKITGISCSNLARGLRFQYYKRKSSLTVPWSIQNSCLYQRSIITEWLKTHWTH